MPTHWGIWGSRGGFGGHTAQQGFKLSFHRGGHSFPSSGCLEGSGRCDSPSLCPQTFLNPWYEVTLGPIFILTLCTGLWAFCITGGSFHNVLKCLSCKWVLGCHFWGLGGARAAGMGVDVSC